MTKRFTTLHLPLAIDAQPPAAYNRTVVFTDVVDSTVLVDQLGDDGLLSVVRHHHQLAAELAQQFDAEHVASTGDGVYAVFDCAERAMAFARRMIAGVREGAATGACPAVRLRVGVASGTVYRWSDDYFGRTMHLAARICRSARPNEVLLDSRSATALLAGSSQLRASKTVELRGFSAAETVHQLEVERPRVAHCDQKLAMA